MNIGILDWVIIIGYLLGCMVAGLWMRRFVKGADDFSVAGRELNVHLGIASLAATELGLVTIMYTAQLGFEKGFAGSVIGLVMAVAMYLVGRTGFVIGPLRRTGVVTIPELFEKRFGKDVRWLAGLFVVLGGLLNMGIFLRLGGEFLVFATGMNPAYLEWVMTVLLGLVLVYTCMGGMLSVLVTDYLQFLVMGVGLVLTSFLVLNDIGWSQLVDGLASIWSSTQAGTAKPGLQLQGHPFNPVHTAWGYILWQMVFQLAVVTTWQTQVSRVLSAKDDVTAQRMYRKTAFYFIGRFALPGLWGAAALVYFTNQGGLPEGVDSLKAMPLYLQRLLPVGILGIVVAGMLAAEMSTDSGYLLTWATVISNDLVAPLCKKPLTPKQGLLLSRVLVVLICIFLLFYGLWYQVPGNAWDYLAVTGNIYLASVFTLLVAGLYWKRASRVGAYAALILGAVGPLYFLIKNHGAAKPDQIAPEIAGAASFGMAFLGMWIGSMLSPSKPRPSNPKN